MPDTDNAKGKNKAGWMLAAAAAALLFHMPAAAAAPAPGLTRLLQAELARFSGTGGIYIKNLRTGEEAEVRGEEHFDSASTIKLTVMVMAYQLADQGKLDLNKRHTLKLSDFRGGSGILKFNDLGLNPTLRDVITQMVITSDNSATDIMINEVGGVDKVNAWLREQGFKTLHLNMTINDYFRRPYDLADPQNKSLSPVDVYAVSSNLPSVTEPRRALIERLRKETEDAHVSEQMAKDALVETTWLGIVSPDEIGKLLEGIQTDTIASKASCDEMKRIMREQQAGTRKIPHYLSVPVAHKTGETRGVTNDVGMIYSHSGPIVIAFYTKGYTGLAGEADERLGQVARLIVEYFDGID